MLHCEGVLRGEAADDTQRAGALDAIHESVLAQDMACRHIIVADGFAKPEIDAWDCEHIVLPHAHEDKGDFARGMGALHALHAGAEFVGFLDADNWLEPNHMSSLILTALKNATGIATTAMTNRKATLMFAPMTLPAPKLSVGCPTASRTVRCAM